MRVRKVVIPVAGMGTRFLPITKSIPKEMLPIVDIPTIELFVEEARNAGIEEIILVNSKRKDVIRKYFEKDIELEEKLEQSNKQELLEKVRSIGKGIKVTEVIQDKPLGSGHAVLQAKELVGNEPFAVMYGDDVIKGGCALKELIEVSEKYDCNVIGAQEVPLELTYQYGIISLSDKETLKINGLVEKPKTNPPSNLAGLGRYILKPEIFEVLENLSTGVNGEYQLTDAMAILMQKQAFHACKFTGTYYDIGSKLGYLKANIMYALDNPELKDKLLEFMKNL